MSKIAITSEGPKFDDLVDSRFGGAAGYVVIDLESMETRYIDNAQTLEGDREAGIRAAELMAGEGVTCILTGFVGPKTFQALSDAKISVVRTVEGMTVCRAIASYRRGDLVAADARNTAPVR